jgi:hypothetical protein
VYARRANFPCELGIREKTLVGVHRNAADVT